ncbi:MAG: copper resistance protein CopC [Acidobacteria bacterium]|nr:copper resistance protein CopC [Acidobacteriota bacterium]
MRVWRIAACAALLIAAAVAAVSAHMAVSKTMPEADAALLISPSAIQVWFTQAPDPAVSRLALNGAAGEIALGELDIRSDKSLHAAVPSTLASGSYTVRWRAAGDDGHTQRGEFSFTVRAAN